MKIKFEKSCRAHYINALGVSYFSTSIHDLTAKTISIHSVCFQKTLFYLQ